MINNLYNKLTMTNFEKVNPKQSFPKLEENILNFWKKEKIFEASIENRADAEEFNFYD
jgi:isoleucyl-tRNA synthetase